MDEAATLSLTNAGDGRLHPARPLLAASLAVFRGDRVLLAQRAVPPMQGCFGLPGGLVEPGETLAEAAVRETREEVGVEARVVSFHRHVELIEHDGAGRVARHYVIASFIGIWIAGEGTVGTEAQSVVWARRCDVAALPTTAQLPALLDAAWAIIAQERPPC